MIISAILQTFNFNLIILCIVYCIWQYFWKSQYEYLIRIYFSRFDANKSTKGASKLRRDLINAEIANLRELLPLPPSTRQRLSQLQLMALVCVYVRKANYFQQGEYLYCQNRWKKQQFRPFFFFFIAVEVDRFVQKKTLYFVVKTIFKTSQSNFRNRRETH